MGTPPSGDRQSAKNGGSSYVHTSNCYDTGDLMYEISAGI